MQVDSFFHSFPQLDTVLITLV
jgi:hypothetical protein